MQHYYSERQESKLNLKKIKVRIKNNEFEFYTASGIFSRKKIDKGTLLLAEKMLLKNNDKVLDLGCGIGILGIVAAKLFPETEIVLTDINRRAYQLTNMNIDLNNAYNAEARQGNLFESVKEKFDAILVNPPQTAGKEICFKIITNSKKYLNEKGTLQLVARHNKGGKELSKKMFETFGNVEEIAKKSGYRIYLSKNVR